MPPLLTEAPNCSTQKHNLRYSTKIENQRHKRKQKGNYDSKYKGIHIRGNKWRVSIRVNKKLINIGYYEIEIVAALAYDRAAIKYFGEFASLNFPKKEMPCLFSQAGH